MRAKPLLLVLILLALGLRPSRSNSAAGGDCLYQCMGSTCADFSVHYNWCGEIRAKCQARCSGRRQWGAIAYSAKDKGYGYSYGFSDLNEAKTDAMRRCSKQGAYCKLQAWFENECGAVAADGNIVTWGTAYLKESAQQRAMLECRKAGGKNCAVQTWVCSKM